MTGRTYLERGAPVSDVCCARCGYTPSAPSQFEGGVCAVERCEQAALAFGLAFGPLGGAP